MLGLSTRGLGIFGFFGVFGEMCALLVVGLEGLYLGCEIL